MAICYWEHVRYLVTPIIFIVFIVVVWRLVAEQDDPAFQRDSRAARAFLWSLLLFLFLVPLEIALLFARTGTPFYERYGIVALIPCAVFPALFLGCRTHCNRLAGSSMAILLAVLFILNTSAKPWLIEHLSSIVRPQIASGLLNAIALPPVAPPRLKFPQSLHTWKAPQMLPLTYRGWIAWTPASP